MSATSGGPVLPDFLVVGAQRAGSTHLAALLGSHPDLFVCPDEVPFFEEPFFSSTPPSALAPAFRGARPGQLLGMQRPDALAKPECPANVASLVAGAAILAVLREPVDRAVSAYFWYMQFGLLPLLPLDEGMARLIDGWTDPAYARAGDVVEYGFYGRHLARYVEVFGSERVLALLAEDVQGGDGVERAFRFLGVTPFGTRNAPFRPRSWCQMDGRVSREPVNAGVYDLRRLRVLRARRRLAWSWEGQREYRYRPRRWRRPLRFVPNAAVVGFDRLVLARIIGDRRPRLRPDLAAALAARYAPDLDVLEHLLGRSLAPWRTRALSA